MKQLSKVQIDALYVLREYGALDDAGLVVHVGQSRAATMRSLERAGFARYFPTPAHWKLTPAGKDFLNEEDSRRFVAEHKVKTDAIVRAYQRGEEG